MVQGHIADMALDIDAAALLVYRAAWTKDIGAPRVTREAAMAKLYATERAQAVIDKAVQIHGGDGVRRGHIVERSIAKSARCASTRAHPTCRKSSSRGRRLREHDHELRSLGRTAHIDTFARDNLPPPEQWPEFLLDGFDYPEGLNAGVELTDRMVEQRLRRPRRADRQRPPPHLQGARPTGPTASPMRWSRITASSPATAC